MRTQVRRRPPFRRHSNAPRRPRAPCWSSGKVLSAFSSLGPSSIVVEHEPMSNRLHHIGASSLLARTPPFLDGSDKDEDWRDNVSSSRGDETNAGTRRNG